MEIGQMPEGQLLGRRYFILTQPFVFYSEVLKQEVTIPVGFECDFESIPFIRGLCRTGGIIHDYLSRSNSLPLVTKRMAALVYREALQYFKHLKWKISAKYWTVRVAWGYFHKKEVLYVYYP